MKKEDGRKMTKVQLSAARRRAIKLLDAGWLQTEVAQAVGVHERTVRQWGQFHREHGLAALVKDERGRAVGDGRTLTPAQEKELRKLITDKLPDQLKLPFALWNRRAVTQLIQSRYGLKLPVRTMGEYLARPLDEPAIDRLIGLIRQSMTLRTSGSIMAGLSSGQRPETLWKMMKAHPAADEGRERFMNAVYNLVDQAKTEGSINNAIPTVMISRMIFCLARIPSDTAVQTELGSSPEAVEKTLDSVVSLFLHGTAPSTGAEPMAMQTSAKSKES